MSEQNHSESIEEAESPNTTVVTETTAPLPTEEDVPLAIDDTDGPLIDWTVTGMAGIAIVAVLLWGLIAPDHFATFANDTLSSVVDNFGWLFVLNGTILVFFVLAIAVSRFGAIKLGKDDEEPEFHYVSWIAMMFAAGMGIGLMFYGAAEPLTYYSDGVPGHQPHEVGTAMATTMFHWTLHPWALYAIVAMSIAYGSFRLGRKQLISAAFIPLIGARAAEGVIGKLIDALAIFATVFGTAASLGLGAAQIKAGLSINEIITNPGNLTFVGIVVILGLGYLASALSGVSKGIQLLSNTNMVLAGLVALFVFVLGPTVAILNLIPTSIANYFDQFFEMAGRTADSANGTAGEWLGGWTIFYWAWWLSWSPFVGMFLARISRGRTIREFVFGVLLVPSAVSVVWFAIFGGSAIKAEQAGESIAADSVEEQLFGLLDSFPAGTAASMIAMVLLATFFITSADSASTVMATMSQNGRLATSRWVVAFWGIATGAIALLLLLTGGEDALGNVQSVTILASTPFVFVIIGLMISLTRGLTQDPMYLDQREQRIFALQMARERRIREAAERKEVQAQRRSENQLRRQTQRDERARQKALKFK
ncbi:BCCT family transporter [Corynebacterium ulceribovis]|uniref:BCCT family transporter n=1 Tax=Corynebacterium ulceribovis TaxID=487732 RepID=UPI00036CC756